MFSNNCASVSSAVWYHLEIEPAERGTLWYVLNCSLSVEFTTNVLSSRQDLLMNSKWFLSFNKVITTEKDALSVDTFEEVVAFNNFYFFVFCFSIICVHFFFS